MEEITLYGAAYGCPRGKRELDCPFKELDHLSYKEKVLWIKEQNDKIKRALILHHENCTRRYKNSG